MSACVFDLPRITEGQDIFMLWHLAYYDGPLSGVALWDGRYVFFNDDDEENHPRRYRVYEMTAAEQEVEIDLHAEFASRVGHHTDYGYIDGKRERAARFTAPEGWHDYYETKRPPHFDVTTHEPVAWFSTSVHGRRPRSIRYWQRQIRRAGADTETTP